MSLHPLSQPVKGITHPYIDNIFVKQGDAVNNADRVMVIDTLLSNAADDTELFDSHLIDILNDLDDLKNEVQNQAGAFNHIEIRTH